MCIYIYIYEDDDGNGDDDGDDDDDEPIRLGIVSPAPTGSSERAEFGSTVDKAMIVAHADFLGRS